MQACFPKWLYKLYQVILLARFVKCLYGICIVLHDDRVRVKTACVDAVTRHCSLPAVHSCACHCVMQNPPISCNLTYSQFEEKKHNESPAKLLTLYLRAGFARLLVTYNTYTPTVYCSQTHFDACFSLHTVHMVTCSLRVFNSVRLPDDWMLDSLHCLKCNSELCFHSYSTMITLWQYVTDTCY